MSVSTEPKPAGTSKAKAGISHAKGNKPSKASKAPATGKDADLDALFQASLKAYEEEANAQATQNHFSADDDVIRLDDSSEPSAAKPATRPTTQAAAGPATKTSATAAADTKGKARQLESPLDKLDSSDALAELRDQGRRAAKRQRREVSTCGGVGGAQLSESLV